jgi:hypothetical protein
MKIENLSLPDCNVITSSLATSLSSPEETQSSSTPCPEKCNRLSECPGDSETLSKLSLNDEPLNITRNRWPLSHHLFIKSNASSDKVMLASYLEDFGLRKSPQAHFKDATEK